MNELLFAAIQAKLKQYNSDPTASFDSILEAIYHEFSECCTTETAKERSLRRQLEAKLEALTIADQADALMDDVVSLQIETERNSFIAGLTVGAKMILDLL